MFMNYKMDKVKLPLTQIALLNIVWVIYSDIKFEQQALQIFFKYKKCLT